MIPLARVLAIRVALVICGHVVIRLQRMATVEIAVAVTIPSLIWRVSKLQSMRLTWD